MGVLTILKKATITDLPADEDLTPAMRQFKQSKLEHPDAVIFFRMGDFYECFYEDAKIVSRELDITLTKRGTKAKIPLAGLPYHAIDTYLPRLVKKGYKVAICEQLEDPKQAKGIVKRGIIRVVTPGTLTTSSALDENSNNFLMSVKKDGGGFGIAITDISTGEFMTSQFDRIDDLLSEIARFMPTELLMEESLLDEKILLEYIKTTDIFINTYEERYFQYRHAYEALTAHFNTTTLIGFGIEDKDNCIMAAGALFNYLRETQKVELKNITKIRSFFPENYMILDVASQKNLEITNNLNDNTAKNTLLSVLDKTKTSMGSRAMKLWIKRPLINKEKIEERYDLVEVLKDNSYVRGELTEIFKQMHDIERLLSKITLKSVNARDLILLKDSLKLLPKIKEAFKELDVEPLKLPPNHLFFRLLSFPDQSHVIDILETSLRDESPLSVREGNMIKDGFSEKLDELRKIITGGKDWLLHLEEKEKKNLGVPVKVGFNRVFGYYIEITRRNIDSVPDTYIRKQTTANAERYITEELKDKESIILNAEEKINSLEYEVFMGIVKQLDDEIQHMQSISQKIAFMDILNSLAIVAYNNNYSRPELHDDYHLRILGSRHPVIEQVENRFIPNDINLSLDKRMMIITGPNMAGKSTYMRQIAVSIIFAQIGSFIPADHAEIPITDRVFTRIGARDDLASGQSTFMVEMNETANILNNATSKSFVILDEIGRGTSTFDGVSIAWSVAEYINNQIQAKCLFATHYHALNKLANDFKEIRNYNIAVKERNDDIIFLRKIVEGATDKSYGIQVARLAGLPNDVILRSKEIMRSLESTDKMKRTIQSKNGNDISVQVSLFDM